MNKLTVGDVIEIIIHHKGEWEEYNKRLTRGTLDSIEEKERCRGAIILAEAVLDGIKEKEHDLNKKHYVKLSEVI